MKSERFLCATIGLVVAYFAVYLGDSVGVLIRSSDFPSGVSMLISIVSIVAVIVGIILMFFSIAEEAISESTFERVFYLIVGPFFNCIYIWGRLYTSDDHRLCAMDVDDAMEHSVGSCASPCALHSQVNYF